VKGSDWVDFCGSRCYKEIGCVRVGALGRRGGCSVAGSDARAAVFFLPQREPSLNSCPKTGSNGRDIFVLQSHRA
jgi:hypothetical protein